MFLTRYRPTSEIDRWLSHFDSTLPAAFAGCFATDKNGDEAKESRRPRTNIRETDKSYVLTMEMPGVTKKDVEVSVENDRLVVRAETTK